jgi:hypothetical protein
MNLDDLFFSCDCPKWALRERPFMESRCSRSSDLTNGGKHARVIRSVLREVVLLKPFGRLGDSRLREASRRDARRMIDG